MVRLRYKLNRYPGRRATTTERISSTFVVKTVIDELRKVQLWPKDGRVHNIYEAYKLKDYLNSPESGINILVNLQANHQNWQLFDFVPSNLGVGYVFYFVCDNCEQKALYLYMLEDMGELLCQKCHRISY